MRIWGYHQTALRPQSDAWHAARNRINAPEPPLVAIFGVLVVVSHHDRIRLYLDTGLAVRR